MFNHKNLKVMFGNYLVDILVPLGVLFIIFYFMYMIIKVLSHRKERQLMVEKMAQNPDLATLNMENQIEIRKSPYNWLKPAGLVIGLGIGFLVASLIAPAGMNGYGGSATMMIISLLLVFGGLGMLGGFFLERSLRRKDGNE